MRASAPKTPSRRLYVFGVVLFVWIFAICFRLVRLQVVKFGFFEDLAERQRTRTVPVEPRRGNIYDRFGHPLAMPARIASEISGLASPSDTTRAGAVSVGTPRA